MRRSWFGTVTRQNKSPSLDLLKSLYAVLVKNAIVTDHNKTLIVEVLRSIAETVIWGDQNDPRVFDFFLEKGIQSYFLSIIEQPKCGTYVCTQLLQTLNILFENIRNETSIYFLLSNNHVNSIICHEFDFSDEEIMAYYISFLKTLSLKLNTNTIHFFYNEHLRDFPLYTEAIKFFNHNESMVRIAVRTLTLNVYRVGEEAIIKFIHDKTAAPYFSNLVWFIGNNTLMMERCLRTGEATHLTRNKLESLVALHLDDMHYVHDIMQLQMQSLNNMLCEHLLNTLFIPLYVYSLDPCLEVDSPQVSTKCALFLLSQVFLILTHPPLVKQLKLYICFEENPNLDSSDTKRRFMKPSSQIQDTFKPAVIPKNKQNLQPTRLAKEHREELRAREARRMQEEARARDVERYQKRQQKFSQTGYLKSILDPGGAHTDPGTDPLSGRRVHRVDSLKDISGQHRSRESSTVSRDEGSVYSEAVYIDSDDARVDSFTDLEAQSPVTPEIQRVTGGESPVSMATPGEESRDTMATPNEEPRDSIATPNEESRDAMTTPNEEPCDTIATPNEESRDSIATPNEESRDAMTTPNEEARDAMATPNREEPQEEENRPESQDYAVSEDSGIVGSETTDRFSQPDLDVITAEEEEETTSTRGEDESSGTVQGSVEGGPSSPEPSTPPFKSPDLDRTLTLSDSEIQAVTRGLSGGAPPPPIPTIPTPTTSAEPTLCSPIKTVMDVTDFSDAFHCPPTRSCIFYDALLSCLELGEDDVEALFSAALLLAMYTNVSMPHKPPAPYFYDDRVIDRLLNLLDKACYIDGIVRPVTVEIAVRLLRVLTTFDGRVLLQDNHIAVLTAVKENSVRFLRTFYSGEDNTLFVELFDEEFKAFQKRRPTNVAHLMSDEVMLLGPIYTPLTGIDFTKRLPCGDLEKMRKSLIMFFTIRKLWQEVVGEEEGDLPLLNLSLQVAKGDILNLNNSDLIACSVVTDKEAEKRFLVIDTHQLILVEPDNAPGRLGHGVVQFVAPLQSVDARPDKDNNRTLVVSIEKSPASPMPITARFMFEDHIRCFAAKTRLKQGRESLQKLKCFKLCHILDIPGYQRDDPPAGHRDSVGGGPVSELRLSQMADESSAPGSSGSSRKALDKLPAPEVV